MERRRASGPATADDQDIGGILGSEIQPVLNGAVSFQQGRQFQNGLVSLIRAESDRAIGAGAEIRVIFVNQLIAIGRRELWDGLFTAGIPGLVNDLLKRVNVHYQAFSHQHSGFSNCVSEAGTDS